MRQQARSWPMRRARASRPGRLGRGSAPPAGGVAGVGPGPGPVVGSGLAFSSVTRGLLHRRFGVEGRSSVARTSRARAGDRLRVASDADGILNPAADRSAGDRAADTRDQRGCPSPPWSRHDLARRHAGRGRGSMLCLRGPRPPVAPLGQPGRGGVAPTDSKVAGATPRPADSPTMTGPSASTASRIVRATTMPPDVAVGLERTPPDLGQGSVGAGPRAHRRCPHRSGALAAWPASAGRSSSSSLRRQRPHGVGFARAGRRGGGFPSQAGRSDAIGLNLACPRSTRPSPARTSPVKPRARSARIACRFDVMPWRPPSEPVVPGPRRPPMRPSQRSPREEQDGVASARCALAALAAMSEGLGAARLSCPPREKPASPIPASSQSVAPMTSCITESTPSCCGCPTRSGERQCLAGQHRPSPLGEARCRRPRLPGCCGRAAWPPTKPPRHGRFLTAASKQGQGLAVSDRGSPGGRAFVVERFGHGLVEPAGARRWAAPGRRPRSPVQATPARIRARRGS